jgi:hypothetical protein
MQATKRGGRSWPDPVLLAVGAITLAGLALRWPSFNDSLFADELSTYFVVNGFGLGGVIDLVESKQEATPPLYYLLASVTQDLWDDPESLRIVPLLSGVAAIPFTYALGRRTVGQPAAVVGAALMAVSPFLIYYSTEARGYSLAMLFALVSTLALVNALDGGRRGWWALYAVCSAGAAYSHYTAIFVLAGQLVWAALAHREAIRALLIANAGAAVLYLPWLSGFLDDRNQPAAKLIDVARPFSFESFRQDVAHWSLFHPQSPSEVLPGTWALWVGMAGVLVGLIALIVRARDVNLREWRPSEGLVLVVVLALVTPIGAALYSSVASSVFLPRNLIASWPGLALAAGAFLTAGRGWLRIAAVALAVGGFAVGGVKMLDPDQQRSDTEGALAFIERESAPGDPIVEQPLPTPGPQTAMEAHAAPWGEVAPIRNPVLELGVASLPERLETRTIDGVGPLAFLEPEPPQRVALEAARLGSGGEIFLVTLGTATIEEIRAAGVGSAAEFLAALPPRFRPAESRSFPGYWIFPLTVHVLEDTRAARVQ